MLKNKKIIGVFVVLILLGVGGFFVYSKNSARKLPDETVFQQEEVIPTIAPSDLGIIFEARLDKKAAKFEIKNSKDIQKVDWEMSYSNEVEGQEVTQGLTGEAERMANGNFGIGYREFGTCSSGKCRYDKVVSDVKLTLKITKTDGKVYASIATLSL